MRCRSRKGGRRFGTIVAGLSLSPYEQTERSALLASLAFAAIQPSSSSVVTTASSVRTRRNPSAASIGWTTSPLARSTTSVSHSRTPQAFAATTRPDGLTATSRGRPGGRGARGTGASAELADRQVRALTSSSPPSDPIAGSPYPVTTSPALGPAPADP